MNKKFALFFSIVLLQSMSANLVHPVTPTIIINLGLPSYIFGLAFAAMSTTSLLFSPFWGKMNEYIGARKILIICNICYAFGQFLFLKSSTSADIIVARLISGAFAGANAVSQMTYIIKCSEDRVSKDLTIFATLTAIGAALGFTIGGIIGKYNISAVFYLQVVLLVTSGVLFFLVLDRKVDGVATLKTTTTVFFKSNPFNYILEMKPYLDKTLIALSFIVFFATFATVSQDQNFNFFIQDVYKFDSSYNGYIKSIVAILGFILNATLCKYIIEKFNISRALKNIFLFLTFNGILIFFVDSPYVFIVLNIVYYAFNIVYTPLLQFIFSNSNKELQTGVLMGYYNTLKSLGMICGSSLAGFFYVLGPKTPFMLSAILFLICAFLLSFVITTTKQRG